MKRFIMVFACAFAIDCHANLVEAVNCQPVYASKPFAQAIIWSDISGFGPAECDYKNPGDKKLTVYKLPKHNEYYRVSGNWRSTMPGTQWCSVENGNTAESCRFALKESA